MDYPLDPCASSRTPRRCRPVRDARRGRRVLAESRKRPRDEGALAAACRVIAGRRARPAPFAALGAAPPPAGRCDARAGRRDGRPAPPADWPTLRRRQPPEHCDKRREFDAAVAAVCLEARDHPLARPDLEAHVAPLGSLERRPPDRRCTAVASCSTSVAKRHDQIIPKDATNSARHGWSGPWPFVGGAGAGGVGGDTTAGIVTGTWVLTGDGGAWACRARAASARRRTASFGMRRVWPAPKVAFVMGDVMWPPPPLLDGAALIHNAVALERHRILKKLVGDGALEVLDILKNLERQNCARPAAGAGSGAVAAMNWSQAASSKSSSSSCCGAALFILAARAFATCRWRSLSFLAPSLVSRLLGALLQSVDVLLRR